jgi:CheY-like chemotaxis protein
VKRPRCLLADDFSDFVELLRVNFRDAPFDCDFVDSGEALLKATEATDYDLIISDLAMSPMGGWEALEELRKARPEQPLWVISAYRQRDMMNDVRAAQLGVLLLDKNKDGATLRDRIVEFFGLRDNRVESNGDA